MSSHADTIRNYIIVSHSTEKLTASALAAVDAWEAEDAQMQEYDHLMVEVSELRAAARRLGDALMSRRLTVADDFGIRPARDPYPPSEPVAKARDAAIERAEAEVQRLRNALELAERDKRIALARYPEEDFRYDP